MSKRKLRFNAIDALIILVIAAAVFVLLYVFVFSGRGTQTTAEVTTTTIRYVVELQNMDEHLQDTVKKASWSKMPLNEKRSVQSAVFRLSPLKKSRSTM